MKMENIFLFFDNASNQKSVTNYEASPDNKLYYESDSKILKGTSETPYCQNTSNFGYYIVTQIRKSKSL